VAAAATPLNPRETVARGAKAGVPAETGEAVALDDERPAVLVFDMHLLPNASRRLRLRRA
jgi:hypothetical protein